VARARSAGLAAQTDREAADVADNAALGSTVTRVLKGVAAVAALI
jgi:hypothetical protein